VTRAVRLLVLVVGLLVVGESRGASPGPLIAAHRGGAGLWPEASRLAFRNALALGVDFLEFDLHLTADGEVVVIHDATLDRTTTARGPVRGVTRAELAAARIRARDGSVTDEAVPTFAQVLELAAPTAVQLLPEIKAGPERKRYEEIEEKVLALLRTYGMLPRATVQSFDPGTIHRLRALEPSVRTMLLVSAARVKHERARPAEAVQWAVDAGATDLGMEHRLIDTGVVVAAQKAKVRLSAWTVNEEADLRRMADLGVDVVMTDYPDLAKRLFGR
jgi:glycerophosphoryl diester phosphodiesterase